MAGALNSWSGICNAIYQPKDLLHPLINFIVTKRLESSEQ
jgi:hypothetical protein